MIGDVLSSTCILHALRDHLPAAQLHYLIAPHTQPVVAGSPYVDQMILAKKDELKIANTALSRRLQAENYDLVIDAYSKWGSAFHTKRSGAGLRIGKHKWYLQWAYTQSVRYHDSPLTEAGLAIENRLQLAQAAVKSTGKLDNWNWEQVVQRYKPKVNLTTAEAQAGLEFLSTHGYDLEAPIVMVSILGSSADKTYPINQMAQVLDTYAASHSDTQFILNYAPNQKSEAKAAYDLLAPATQAQTNWDAYPGSLREFLTVLAHCNACIGNEGGDINMAKAVYVPTFAIFSPWIPHAGWASYEQTGLNASVHLQQLHPEIYQGQEEKALQAKATELYKKLEASVVSRELEKFIGRMEG